MSEQLLSVETLRSELAVLELRLVDRLTSALEKKADIAEVSALEGRVGSLELSRASREHMAQDLNDVDIRLVRIERFRYAVPGMAFLSFLVAVATLVITGPHP